VPVYQGGLLSSVPCCRIYSAAGNQSIPSAAWTVLNTFDTKRFDTDNIFAVAQPDRLVCRTAGKYLIFAQIGFAANATGRRHLQLAHSTGGTIAHDVRPTTAAGNTGIGVATVYDLAVNDYIQASVFQDSGAALPLVGAASPQSWSCEMGMQYLGPSGSTPPPVTGVPSPAVNGQWIKGAGGVPVWSDIGSGDVRSGIQERTGHKYEAAWETQNSLLALQHYIDGTRVGSSPFRWMGPYSFDSTRLANAAYTSFPITHNFGRDCDIIVGSLTDIYYGFKIQWQATNRSANSLQIMMATVSGYWAADGAQARWDGWLGWKY